MPRTSPEPQARICQHLRTYLDEMVVMNLSPGGDEILARLVLERILSKLRPQVRSILFLSLAEGLTYAETAKVLASLAGGRSEMREPIPQELRVDRLPEQAFGEGIPSDRKGCHPLSGRSISMHSEAMHERGGNASRI